MRLVILESPYAGDIKANVKYARACVRDCLKRNESALASHIFFTQPGILRDDVPTERLLGIEAGLAWGRVAEATVVYIDRGISRGMQMGIEDAALHRRPVEFRNLHRESWLTKLGKWASDKADHFLAKIPDGEASWEALSPANKWKAAWAFTASIPFVLCALSIIRVRPDVVGKV